MSTDVGSQIAGVLESSFRRIDLREFTITVTNAGVTSIAGTTSEILVSGGVAAETGAVTLADRVRVSAAASATTDAPPLTATVAKELAEEVVPLVR